MRGAGIGAWVLIVLAVGSGTARAEDAEGPAVLRGTQFLRGQAAGLKAGEAALAGLALVKAEVPATDPGMRACLKKVLERFATTSYTYTPDLPGPGGHSIYEAAVISLFLANLDPVAYKPQIDAVALYLINSQMSNGAWDYPQRKGGDASISQYAILGLWEADNAGATVPPQVWDRAARWYLSVQDAQGGWCYHRDEGSQDTVSMTAAGVGTLLICKRQLDQVRQAAGAHNPLMTPVLTDARAPVNFKATTSAGEINAAVNRGFAWIAARFKPGDPIMGMSTYYGLYGIERIGALADRETLGRIDWFARGGQYILSAQGSSGEWNDQQGAVVNTAWALLFLTKSTAKSIKRIEIRRLGAGTLIGGRGLPKDLSSLTIAGGRVLARPMNGAVESMLGVLEDPRAENADGALSGLIARYETEGPNVLRPFKGRFRKLMADRDPGIRSAAAWALGRTGDLDVVPDLIALLADTDDSVVLQARTSLQLLSRKIDGFGPPAGASPAVKTDSSQGVESMVRFRPDH